MNTNEKYKGYIIERGGLGYTYIHENYEGVFEYDGETGAPSEYDNRAGSAYTIEQCKEEIDEIELEREEKRAEKITDKYPSFPLGHFQDIVNTANKMYSKIDAYLKTKPVLSTCKKFTVYIDDEIGSVECYYRFVNECPNAQTDVPETFLTIELVTKDGVEIKLDRNQYLDACEIISRKVGMNNVWEFKNL